MKGCPVWGILFVGVLRGGAGFRCGHHFPHEVTLANARLLPKISLIIKAIRGNIVLYRSLVLLSKGGAPW